MAEQEVKKIEDQNQLLGTMDQCGERAEYHNLVDILFVIDATGSMSWCISQMKKTVCKIMKKFSDKQYNIKFAIQLYRDHPPQEYSYVEKHFDLRNQDDIINVIDAECDVAGGGDTPEAVFDGLVNGLKKTSWRVSTDGKTKSKRFLFHGCDAPPHGKQYGCTSSDQKWTNQGCPCGLTRHDVKKLLDEHNVDYSLIKCGNQTNTMGTLFKQCFSEKFKRQMEITKSNKHGGRKGGKLQRKRSIQYMEQIQRQEDYSYDDEECEAQYPCQKPSMELKQSKESPSILSSIKRAFGVESKKKVEVPKMMSRAPVMRSVEQKMKCSEAPMKKAPARKKVMKKQSSSSSDSGDGSGGRSMASLVLSDVEDGVQSYFDSSKQKKQSK